MSSGLPSEQREALDAMIARLIERAGWERFVLAPILEPSAQAFPDPWEPNAQGVARVTRRLLSHAGIESPRVRVTDYTALAHESTVTETEVSVVDVADDGTVLLELHSLGEEVDLVGVLCHEAADAWLRLRGNDGLGGDPFRGPALVEAADDEMSRARASVAAIYLGFGVPATNAAHNPRHGGYVSGQIAVSEWAITMAGGLSLDSMVYLFAVQLAVRGRADERRAALANLHANQRAELERWLGQLDTKAAKLRERFGLPAKEAWPEPWPMKVPVLPGGGERVDVGLDPEDVRMFNRGRPVFRVRYRRTTVGLVAGLVAGFAAGIAGMKLGLPDVSVLGFVALGALVGAALGRRSLFWSCSDRECEIALVATDDICPGCGGAVSGELLRAADRLEAEEAILEARKVGEDRKTQNG